jgi:hypothetical protein
MNIRLTAISVKIASIIVLVCHAINGSSEQNTSQGLVEPVVEIYANNGRGVTVGSGFFISSKGDIATAYHVIRGAKSVQIVGHSGSFTDVSIIAYDASKDLAIVKVKGPDSFPFFKIVSPSNGLSNKSGYVVGNPDQKADFAVHVTFPRDATMYSREWSVATATQGSTFIFANGDVRLVAIDGTLNHGMSGGPLLLDGNVIGVFSGGEENSGGGLGWAISAEYLAALPPAPAGTKFSDLPPLTLLATNSASPWLEKAIQTPRAGEAFADQMALVGTVSNFEALSTVGSHFEKWIQECKPFYADVKTGNAPKIDSLAQDGCLDVTLLILPYFGAISALSNQLNGELETLPSKAVPRYLEHVSKSRPIEIKQGKLRLVQATSEVCTNMNRNVPALRAAGKQFTTVVAPFNQIAAFPPFGNAVSLSDVERRKKVLNYLKTSDGPILIDTEIAALREASNVISAYIGVATPPLECEKSMTRVIDFKPDYARIDEHVRFDDLTDTELATYLGQIMGFYYLSEYEMSFCMAHSPATKSAADAALFAFKQKNFLLIKRARERGTNIAGAGDITELETEARREAAAKLDPILTGMAEGHVDAFCRSAINTVITSDAERTAPDAVEAVLRTQVPRPPRDSRSDLGQILGSAFTQAISQGPAASAELVKSAMPTLQLVMVRSWIKLLIEQCADLGSPLAGLDASRMKQIDGDNTAELLKDKTRAKQVLVQNGVSADDAVEFFDTIDQLVYEENTSLQQHENVKSSEKITYLCKRFASNYTSLSDSDVLRLVEKLRSEPSATANAD